MPIIASCSGVTRSQALLVLMLLVALVQYAVDGKFEPNSYGETKIYTSQGTHKDYFGMQRSVYLSFGFLSNHHLLN